MWRKHPGLLIIAQVKLSDEVMRDITGMYIPAHAHSHHVDTSETKLI